MAIFDYQEEDSLGKVFAVDTTSVILNVDNIEKLRSMQVNRLVALRSSRAGQHLIGMVNKIVRKSINGLQPEEIEEDELNPKESNSVRITLIGTFFDRVLEQPNVFRRTLETVPEIDANCFPIDGAKLTAFMTAISFQSGEERQALSIGNYTLDDSAIAYLDANKFFQRHAVIVGSTGSGKSWTTAKLLEQVATLDNSNAILFDLHGEYKTLTDDGIKHYRIAGPSDIELGKDIEDGILCFPYWLLGYEDMMGMLVDRSDQNAPNQAMVLSRTVIEAKRRFLEAIGEVEIINNFTVDSPVPYMLSEVLDELIRLDSEMVQGAKKDTLKQGEFHGKLSRFIARLENKVSDKRLAFMMNPPDTVNEWDWMNRLSNALLSGREHQNEKKGGVKIIDLSEVPSDILPMVIGRIASLIFSLQQWTKKEDRHPIALLCDEAHLYIPEISSTFGLTDSAQRSFERIAKEGRKYGVGLVVISQRPSEVNKTILSQCSNFISMRLSNAEDQNVIKRLLPDNLGGFTDLLPVLDRGEALIVGDASLLPSRVRISEPNNQPDSGTIDFWDEWMNVDKINSVEESVKSWRMQSMVRRTLV
ncbi:ATP-binding protein [Neobacillus sp. PS3-40]|uniref:ATP-binding protein n=1 Tax=Neobacillus sp. PS3-40 TaxID=3070679 RepID=UPI0027E1F059|nr:ATP-binding protein [Neobacillus sp. PS3-40]WML45392.1 ATP-binding protein [Neobacillus sp. PS3-40]